MIIMSEKVEETVEKTFDFDKDFINDLEKEAESSGRSEAEVLKNWAGEGVWVLTGLEVEESVVSLQYVNLKDMSLDEVGEDGLESEKNLNIFRDLRENFGPVSAGVDYLKAFVGGSGFTVGIDDAKNEHQKETKSAIIKFNGDIFMDEITKGLDTILDIILEEAYTDGCAATEIVYKKFREVGSFNFRDYVEEAPITVYEEGKKIGRTTYIPKELDKEAWKELGGIVQLKVIMNSYGRVKPYRHPKTFQILYYTVDEKQVEAWNARKENREDKREPIKLLPWQIFWFSPARKGWRLKGPSHVKPAAEMALLLRKILKDIGTNIAKWADKKYFFILGSDKSRAWAKPHVANFLRNVKKLGEKGKTAIPVPPGFDLKEIGGEVYDGGQILDKLISMICSAMKYPRTFSEQGKTQEGDKAWLAWLVTYGRHQTQLRRAVEHQLWTRHLYCKYGLIHDLTKPGPAPKGGRSTEDTYVPKMVWRSEGKWHRETKLKMLQGILNVANPVGPELKLATEEDMAVTLGYTEMDFDMARKLLEINLGTEEIEREIEQLKAKMLKETLEKAYEAGAHLEMIPTIVGLKTEEPEQPEPEGEPPGKKLPPEPGARQKGGVSKTIKKTGGKSKKGMAKPMGGSRQPSGKRVGETLDLPIILGNYAGSLDRRREEESRKPEIVEVEREVKE